MYFIFIGKTPEKSSSADGLKAKKVQNVWRGWLSMALEERQLQPPACTSVCGHYSNPVR
jgi:hypothetical protein